MHPRCDTTWEISYCYRMRVRANNDKRTATSMISRSYSAIGAQVGSMVPGLRNANFKLWIDLDGVDLKSGVAILSECEKGLSTGEDEA